MQRWMLLGLFAFCLDAMGQPAALTLRAKLRDFRDYLPTDTTTHPDFENDRMMGCGGRDLGFVKDLLDTAGSVDTLLYRGDNRNPVLQKLSRSTGTLASPCFTSIARFGEWYNDRPAVNRSFYLDLTLTRNAQGMYTYNNDNFLPLNAGAGWGKFRPADPDPFGPRADITPNDVWGFTMELHTSFTYLAGQNQIFIFKGDDDVWVFIKDRLVIDLGGLHDQLTDTVKLDEQAAALGLQNGGSYPLDFFFAERHSTGSHCRITTSLQLSQVPELPAPVATPPGRTFTGSIEVGLSVPGQAGAEIRYTTDGSEPGPASPLYTAPLNFSANTTLKAKAFKADFLPSPTLTETYTREKVNLPAPVAAPPGQTFLGTLSVTLSVPGHADAEIRYTTDGGEPGPASPLYTAPLTLSENTTVKAMAFKADFLPSAIMTETYVRQKVKLPTPVAAPPGQTFLGTLSVTLSVPGHSDAVIRYTRDGSIPDSASPVYSGPLVFTAGGALKAKAFQAGWLPSDAMSEVYVLELPPNVVTLRMDTTMRKSGADASVTYPWTVLNRPIAAGVMEGGAFKCLACPPGTQDVFQQRGGYPEWTVTSRKPFRYEFHIYDNLGQFVIAESGDVSAAQLDLAPGDKEGYRSVNFRWIPVAHDGSAVGTGAYILRGRVASENPAGNANGGKTVSILMRTFGYLRQD